MAIVACQHEQKYNDQPHDRPEQELSVYAQHLVSCLPSLLGDNRLMQVPFVNFVCKLRCSSIQLGEIEPE